ncbi:hypothetical protein A2U01_0002198, partial [Trifolium medium]|nr:hypothetical protein [Trifolium medium]
MSETSVVVCYSNVAELSLAATNHAIAEHFSLAAVAAAIEAKIQLMINNPEAGRRSASKNIDKDSRLSNFQAIAFLDDLV